MKKFSQKSKDSISSSSLDRLDDLDRNILKLLQSNARCSFTEMARKLKEPLPTVHQRFQRLEEAGYIEEFTVKISKEKMGFGLTALIGVQLEKTSLNAAVQQRLFELKNVLDIYYTTGSFAFILKVCCKDIKDLHLFLSTSLQAIPGIRSTETFICLSTPMERSLPL